MSKSLLGSLLQERASSSASTSSSSSPTSSSALLSIFTPPKNPQPVWWGSNLIPNPKPKDSEVNKLKAKFTLQHGKTDTSKALCVKEQTTNKASWVLISFMLSYNLLIYFFFLLCVNRRAVWTL